MSSDLMVSPEYSSSYVADAARVDRPAARFAKRLFDVAISSLALLVLAPVFLLAAMAIRLHDGGPALYRQKRVGYLGGTFVCLKFRTMTVDADARLKRWARDCPELHAEFLRDFKLRSDPRVTAPGRWLRRTSLDELPQLFNVLLGDMSLIGPRPVLEQELVERYGRLAQIYTQVRPGITGLWQISGRSDTTYEERVNFDERYILNWSFGWDIRIFLKTLVIVVRGKGAR